MDFILLVIVLVALAWAPILLGRSSLALASVAFLVLTNCVGLEFLSVDIGPMNMSIDRFFLLVLPLAYVMQRRSRRLDPKPIGRTEIALGAFTLLLVVSTFTHDWQSTNSFAPVVQHLINGYLTPLVLFWIARQIKITERELRHVYAAMVAFGVYLAFTGICEANGAWSLVFPKHIADPKIGLHFGRARGPMVHSVTYGMALATSAFCGWQLWCGASRQVKLFLLALLPLALAALFYSKTRSVWMGTAAGTLLLMLTMLRGSWRPIFIGGIACAGLLVAATNFDRILAFDRKDNNASETRESVAARGSFVFVSWKMFQERPLLGFGFGQFPRAKLPYLADRTTDLRLETIRPWVHHNTYLSLLTELGLVGLALFVGILLAWVTHAWRLWRNAATPDWVRGHAALTLAVIAMYLVQCAFHEMSFSTRDHSLLFFFGGLICGLSAMATRNATFAALSANWLSRWRPQLAVDLTANAPSR